MDRQARVLELEKAIKVEKADLNIEEEEEGEAEIDENLGS
jgi:hypothetical protein